MDSTSSNYIWGATAIAKELGIRTRQAFHLLEKGHVPARKVGARWAADRRALRNLLGAYEERITEIGGGSAGALLLEGAKK